MTPLALILTAVLCALNLADAWTTWRGMTTDVSREANPLLERLRRYIEGLPRFGPWLWLALAKSLPIIILALGWIFNFWPTTEGIVALIIITVVYAVVVRKNYRLLKK